jgi:molybdate transport system substrate-binding protein
MPDTPRAVRGISSMATRALLAELCADFTARTGVAVAIESVGGVDAARRVAQGERFDVVVLASDAIDRLLAAGHLVAPRVDVVRSPVAVAVPAGRDAPAISDRDALLAALRAAPRIGVSTGPSGVTLLQRLADWGLDRLVAERCVQAPPGVPVATLLARGDVDLGFQQLSEMLGAPGIRILGPLPDDVAIVTTFSAAAPAPVGPDVDALLRFFTDPQTAAAKRRHGMSPA